MISLVLGFVALAFASSHSEAPGTARGPAYDLTDFYLFTSPTPGNVVLVMNIAGLTQSQAGPNYNPINNDHVYQIHIDNDGDAREDVTFQFVTGYRYANNGRGVEVPVQGRNVPIPLSHILLPASPGVAASIAYDSATGTTTGLNVEEYYRVRVLRGDDYSGAIEDGPFASTTVNGETVREFTKAFENAGTFSFGETVSGGYDKYEAYVAEAATYTNVQIPGCASPASFFVGPRRESFGIALGEVFDGINISPAPVFELGSRTTSTGFDGNSLDRFGVISFVVEIAASCLQNDRRGDTIGAWTSVRQLEHRSAEHGEAHHYAGAQTTRLGNPLVNELLIGTTYKNEWNSRHPSGDVRFNEFLLFPVFPLYIQVLYGAGGIRVNTTSAVGAGNEPAAPNFPRTDLVAVFHTGIAGVNQIPNTALHRDDDDDDDNSHRRVHDFNAAEPVYADMLRLNLTLAAYKNCSEQSPLGAVGLDFGGYPNGRRLGDDVVDITLRVAMGFLCASSVTTLVPALLPICNGNSLTSPSATYKYTDQAPTRACMFKCDRSVVNGGRQFFPYLNPNIPGNDLFSGAYAPTQFQIGCNGYDNGAFTI